MIADESIHPTMGVGMIAPKVRIPSPDWVVVIWTGVSRAEKRLFHGEKRKVVKC